MTRVLALVPSGYVSGMQFATFSLFGALSPNTQAHFIVSRWNDGDFPRRLDALHIPYTLSWIGMISRQLDPKNLRMTLEALLKAPILYWDFLHAVRRFQPDVLYFAHYHQVSFILPILYMLRKPVIYHAHNLMDRGPFQRKTFKLWGPAITRFIGVSTHVCDSIAELGVARTRISVLHNAIDLQRFAPRTTRSNVFTTRFGWPTEALVVGMTGQMMEGKGQLDFLTAAAAVHREFPATRFVIGGRQNEAFFEVVKARAAELGLASVVGYSGWQEDMPAFYAGLDILVFPSRFDEGFGLIIAEAMAVGVPAVATRTGGTSEVVADGVTGLLVTRGAADELTRALRRLVAEPALRATFSQAGRARVAQEFGLTIQTERFEALLAEIGGQRA